MPQNKRESLIYSVLMCFCMVLWMSIYNVSLHQGGLSLTSVQEGWLGFPIAYVFAFCCDWFFVSKLAKGVAFGFLLKPDSSPRRKVITISTCMDGGSDGHYHVAVRRCRGLCPHRHVVGCVCTVAAQYPV